MSKNVVPRLPPFIRFPSKAAWMGMWGKLKSPLGLCSACSVYLWVTPQTNKVSPFSGRPPRT